ncbi:Segregation and condensation protein B [Frankliniella fusca]|uniref:Segregation and condensation protein B n=1 Tax=Frankliniella fusca TaxID=407009 RepID=A0AAE1I0V5_9NEOP|nr:Segregation and condensation protein B [Frankliniella fusca]
MSLFTLIPNQHINTDHFHHYIYWQHPDKDPKPDDTVFLVEHESNSTEMDSTSSIELRRSKRNKK